MDASEVTCYGNAVGSDINLNRRSYSNLQHTSLARHLRANPKLSSDAQYDSKTFTSSACLPFPGWRRKSVVAESLDRRKHLFGWKRP